MQKLPIWRHFHTTACKFKEIPKKSKSHSSQLWLTRQLSDPFVEMAKTQNYRLFVCFDVFKLKFSNISDFFVIIRCRSAFKLLEIDDKTHILAAGHTVIDCGGAPGSWTQVAVTRSNADGKIKNKPKGFVIGIDLLNIYPIEVNSTHYRSISLYISKHIYSVQRNLRTFFGLTSDYSN